MIATEKELIKQQIADFSRQEEQRREDAQMLILRRMNQKISGERKVSADKNTLWLMDDWCGQGIRGRILMPFSRHWMMHAEACLRMKNKAHPQA